TSFSTPFRGVLAPSGPQISAESGRATQSLAPGKPGWPPTSTWPLFSRPTPPPPRPPPPQRGQVLRRPPPPWLLPATDNRIGKDRTGPDLDDRPLSIQYVTKSGDSRGKINPFLPTRYRPTVKHSLAAADAQRQ